MKSKDLKEIYLNWKGLGIIYSFKSVVKWSIFVLSVIFIIISLTIQNYYLAMVSLILSFMQILSETKKDPYLKYGEIFERLKHRKETISDKEWISYLENTSGLHPMQKGFFNFFLKNKYKKDIKS